MATYAQRAADGLRQVRGELIEELEQIDKALASFEGAGSVTKRPRRMKPCCTKQEVTEIVAKLLCDRPALGLDEIEALAKENASKVLGKNLSGFAMRLKEALADPLFKEFEPGRYRLAPIDERPTDKN